MAQALRYPASRYRTEAPPDLNTRAARERLSGPGLKAFFNIAARWKMRDEDARALLGGVTNGPFYEMKRNPDRVLDTVGLHPELAQRAKTDATDLWPSGHTDR